MRVAIILTGALRTIRKTIRYFKQNLVSDNTDVFACVQNDTTQTEEEWNRWFAEQIHITSLVWFSLSNHGWIQQRELLLEHICIDETWKGYLRHSGSMIEYAQLQQAYLKMTQYEHMRQQRYDYIIRARTDSIYCKRIDFHWLQWTDEEVSQRIAKVREEMILSKIDLPLLSKYVMTTLISDHMISNIPYIHATVYTGMSQKEPTIEELAEYIRTGRYILTFRKNNLYIVRRDLFHLIPSLGTMYGQFQSPYSDPWWFNAEGQFTSICYHAGLTTYDYNTDVEDKSVEVTGWNDADFFDEHMNCINPRMVYCVVRR
jgi:hypothetical protein